MEQVGSLGEVSSGLALLERVGSLGELPLVLPVLGRQRGRSR